jgi:outer membrane protein TolC
MWQAGGSVALPSRARVRAAVAEAEARLSASRVRVVDVRVRLRAAVEQRMALLDAAEQIAATYRDGLLPQSDLAVRSALARYAAGEGPQAAALEATAAAIEDQIDYVRLLATRVSEHARLEEASLDDPVGIDSLLAHGRGGGAGMGSTPSAGGDMTSRKSNPGMQAR